MTNERKLELLAELTTYASSGQFNTESYVQLLTNHINEGFVTSHQFLVDFIIDVAVSTKNYDLILLAVNTSNMTSHYEINDLSYEDYQTLEQLKIKAYCYYVRYVDSSKRSEAERMIYCYQDSFGDGKVYEYQAILDKPSDDEDNPFARSMVESYLIKCLIYGNELDVEKMDELHLLKDTFSEDLSSLFERAKEEYRLSYADVESSKVHLQSAYELSLAILHQCFKKNKYEVFEYEKLSFYILKQYSSMSKLYIDAYLDAKYRFDIGYKKRFDNSAPYFNKKDIKPIKTHVNNISKDDVEFENRDVEINKVNNKKVEISLDAIYQVVPKNILIVYSLSLIALIILSLIMPRNLFIDSMTTAVCLVPLTTVAYLGFNKKSIPSIVITLILIFIKVLLNAILFGTMEFFIEMFIRQFISIGVIRSVIIPGIVCLGGSFITKKFIKNSILNALVLYAISVILLLIIVF